MIGQPPRPPWRCEHRSATTSYRHHADGRVGIVWHHRVESGGWREDEFLGATKDEAEQAWLAYLSERSDAQLARSKRRAKWGLRGGWQT